MSEMKVVRVKAPATLVAAYEDNSVKRIWDNYVVVGEVQKSAKLKHVIAAAVRDGVRYINIREFYLRKKDETWMPSRDGITVPLIYPLEKGTKLIYPVKEFIQALQQTIEVLETLELYDENNAVYNQKKGIEND